MGGMDDADQLERELATAASATLNDAYRQPGDKHEEKRPILARVVRAVAGDERWQASPTEALIYVIQLAIGRLPEQITVREGRNPRPPVPARGKPEKQIAALLYGYRQEELPPRFNQDGSKAQRTYDDDFRPAALRVAGFETNRDDSSAKRVLRVIRRDLAVALLQMEQEAISAEAAATAAPADDDETSADSAFLIQGADATAPQFSTPYISRDQLFIDFMHAWLTEDAVELIEGAVEREWPLIERICLVGDAGTGKTRFLQHTLDGMHPIWINAEADETMVPTMLDVLTEWVEGAPRYTEASLIKRDFGRLLAHPEGPPLVIFDNVPDPVMLDHFVPHTTYTRLLVTSRKRPPKDWSPVVEVTDMTLDEATGMARALLPQEVSMKDSQALAITLGRCPLLIEHACAFLAQDPNSDIEDFCAAVSLNITSALGAISDRTDRAMTAIYRLHVTRLREEAPESLRLLELLPFLPHQYVPHEYLMAFLLGVPYISKNLYSRANLAYRAAIRPLQTHSLVTVDESMGVFMRPLVQNILRRIYPDRLAELVSQLPPKVEREALYEAGWHAYTVSGREMCNRVMFIRLLDGTLLKAGYIPFSAIDGVHGVRWELMVERFRDRTFRFEMVLCTAEGRLPRDDDGFDLDTFAERAKKLPHLQAKELLAVAAWETLTTENRQKDGPAQGTPEWEEEFVDAMLSLRLRHEDSQLGQLDFGLLDPNMIPDDEVEEAKQYLRNLFFPKDKGSVDAAEEAS